MWTLPRNARLEDVQEATAYYAYAGSLVELSLSSDTVRRNVASGTNIQVEGTRQATAQGRVVTLRQPLP